jgi:hypothetical protein
LTFSHQEVVESLIRTLLAGGRAMLGWKLKKQKFNINT